MAQRSANIPRVPEDGDDEDAVVVPIERELDLHTFAPRDVASVVSSWLEECVARGFDEVRIVHGKGIGNLRRTVHAVLERHPSVKSFRLAGSDRGSWGATLATLTKPKEPG